VQLFDNMKILAIGSTNHFKELTSKFGTSHTYSLASSEVDAMDKLNEVDIVFHFLPSLSTNVYRDFKKPVFLNTTFFTLSDIMDQAKMESHDSVFGFCGLPTFLNRPVLEVTTASNQDEERLDSVCNQLNTNFVRVDDRIGLVTPKVICMIINEAYLALEEEVAKEDDIDLAMKLGTNYPFGPFEWAKKIGIREVIGLLDAVYRNTGDTRYKVCKRLQELSNNRE
jgi:3-hydroxybutyryl-CoA dehydrogenase